MRKVRAGMMPPSGMPRPDRATLDSWTAKLETELDRAAAAKPNPGSTGLHRLNRTEYTNAIRDLLAIDVDGSTLLPADDSSEGFDNIADALAVSPALIERYVAAAGKISRLAVGNMLITPSTVTYRAPADLSQSEHVDGLPLGTRGGMLVRHTFPLDAEYSFKVRARSAGIGVGGAGAPGEELEVVLNGERVKLADRRHDRREGSGESGTAGHRRRVCAEGSSRRGRYLAGIRGQLERAAASRLPGRSILRVRETRPAAARFSCAIRASEARRIGVRQERFCRRSRCARIASRRRARIWTRFWASIKPGGRTASFDLGIEQALARVLVDPRFVFRFEREPAGRGRRRAYRVSDLELASRLSFFLWSSIPDDELLDVAVQGKLHDPAVLEKQTLPHADGSAFGDAGDQFRRAVAVSARVEERASRGARV